MNKRNIQLYHVEDDEYESNQDIHQKYYEDDEDNIIEFEMNENDSISIEGNEQMTIEFIIKHTQCSFFQKIYDSDEMEFNQRAFQSVVVGRTNVLGIVITENGDVFGSFHTVKIEPMTNDLNWTKDNNFFVYSILKDGQYNYQIYKKNEGVYCKERSIRIVYDDETFYRINNAFYLRPTLYAKRGKTWDDFGKDYSLKDEKYFFTTRYGFTPIRVIAYQCY